MSGLQWVRGAVTDSRRVAHLRVVLAFLLTMLAVPATAQLAWHGLWGRGPNVPLLIPLAAVIALLIGGLGAQRSEPDVHDRQVDVLIAGALLFVATAVAVMAPSGPAASTTWPLIASVAYLAAAMTLLLGTRAAARLRWALIFPLVAVEAAVPPLLERAAGWLVRGGAMLLSAPFGGRLDLAALNVAHGDQILVISPAAIPAVALAGAVICVLLAGLCCFGLSRRCLARVASAAVGLAVVAVLGISIAMVVGRLFGAGPMRMVLVPAVLDLALAGVVAVLVYRWSRRADVPRTVERQYLPRGRIGMAVLALAAIALGLRALPDLAGTPPRPVLVVLANPAPSAALVFVSPAVPTFAGGRP